VKMLCFFIGLTLTSGVFASRLEVDIVGMSCGMCIESITKELKGTQKVENVSVSLEEKKARFDEMADRKISDAEIRSAIKKAGYEAVKIRRN
jgi:copper chaperone